MIATGPGHGIRLVPVVGGSGPGEGEPPDRLVVPVWLSTSSRGPHRPSCVATLYSDDDGKTWQRGDIVPTPGLVNPSETAIAQVDGTVILNIRHEGEPHQRAVVTGPDGATKWGPVRFDDGAAGAGVHGKHAVDWHPRHRKATELLFCNPHNPDNRVRKNLTVKVSLTQGRSWPGALTIEPGPGGYSDLAASRGEGAVPVRAQGHAHAGSLQPPRRGESELSHSRPRRDALPVVGESHPRGQHLVRRLVPQRVGDVGKERLPGADLPRRLHRFFQRKVGRVLAVLQGVKDQHVQPLRVAGTTTRGFR